jgi:glycosyltransferase involved in cell wall biosynthesis
MTIRILYLITSTNTGGTEKALLELVKRINRKVYSVHVCSIKKPGKFAPLIADKADSFCSLGLSEQGTVKSFLNFLPALLKLIRIIKQLKPKIIHCFLFRANILGRIAGRFAGTPVIISSIRVIEEDKPLKHLIDRFTASMVDKYTAVSESARLFTIKKVGLSPEKIITVYNGIECGNDPEQKSGTRKEGHAKIALIGRFDLQKGHDILLDAMQIINSCHCCTDIKLFFFGEGPDETRIRNRVRQLNMSEQIFFMGTTHNIRKQISKMDIIVQPSLWEGLPNSVLEAMSESRPVIASEIAGINELVVDGKTGLLFESGNAGALAAAILKLTNNRGLSEKMGREAKSVVIKNFSIKKTINETMSVYHSLLKKHVNYNND